MQPSREWLLKMADAEDAAGSVSVGGLAVACDMCVHCGGSIMPGGECDHCGIHDGRERFHSDVRRLMVRMILCLPPEHSLRSEAIAWLKDRGLIRDDMVRALNL